MFSNIGGKIKTLTTIICIIGIAISVISGITLIAINDDLALIGIAIMLVGSLSSWLSSFVLYGFGEIIDQLTEINHNTKRSAQLIARLGANQNQPWICTSCQTQNSSEANFCIKCGSDR